MIDWFKVWSRNIVVAVIVGSLIEMILPSNTSKKYIKIVVGIFIVYNIITPIINSFWGQDVYAKLNLNEISQEASSTASESTFSKKANDSVKRVYIQNLQNDIKNKLKEKGYVSNDVIVQIADDDSYNVTKIDIKIESKIQNGEKQKQAYTIVDAVKYVTIKVSGDNQENKVINDSDINTIKNLCSENYSISAEKINVS